MGRMLTSTIAIICGLAAIAPAGAQTVEQPLRAVSDPGIITTRQAITPAGVQTVFDGRVFATAFGEGNVLWALTRNQVYKLDWKENRVLARHAITGSAGIRGLAIDPASGDAIVSFISPKQPGKGKGGSELPGRVGLFQVSDSGAKAIATDLGSHAAGALSLAGQQVLTPLTFDNKLAIADRASGTRRETAVGVAPVAAVAHGGMAYVANWGGQKAAAGQRSAPTGMDKGADRLAIDARGVAEAGTISVVDLDRAATVATVGVGRHPTALALDAAGKRLFVANTNDDSISVIDLASRMVSSIIVLQPFATKADGIAPSALAFDAARNRLYIACGGINAIAVYDLTAGRIAGLIPTGWYPVSVSLNASGDALSVGAYLGVGSGKQGADNRRQVHVNRGTAHVIPVPDDGQLASYTAAVAENNRMSFATVSPVKADPNAVPKAVPLRAGEPSLIEHVVFIVKENRTYDQVLGALGRGNGDPSLVMFGEDVTPNTHKLSRDFVTLDNMYATGGNSANGHQWVTQANEVSYTIWPGYEGRSYAAYVQTTFAAGALRLTPGVRAEWIETHNTSHVANFSAVEKSARTAHGIVLPGLGLTWSFSPAVVAFAGVHRGFAPPRPDRDIDPLAPFHEVRPERSTEFELGLRARPVPALQVNLTLFQMVLSDLIVEGQLVGGRSGTFVNAGRARHCGLELEGGWSRGPVRLGITYTWLEEASFLSDVGDGLGGIRGNRIPYSPEHMIDARIGLRVRKGMEVELGTNHVSQQFANADNTVLASADGLKGTVPARTILRLAAKHDLRRKGWQIYLAAENILDTAYISSRIDGLFAGTRRQLVFGLKIQP